MSTTENPDTRGGGGGGGRARGGGGGGDFSGGDYAAAGGSGSGGTGGGGGNNGSWRNNPAGGNVQDPAAATAAYNAYNYYSSGYSPFSNSGDIRDSIAAIWSRTSPSGEGFSATAGYGQFADSSAGQFAANSTPAGQFAANLTAAGHFAAAGTDLSMFSNDYNAVAAAGYGQQQYSYGGQQYTQWPDSAGGSGAPGSAGGAGPAGGASGAASGRGSNGNAAYSSYMGGNSAADDRTRSATDNGRSVSDVASNMDSMKLSSKKSIADSAGSNGYQSTSSAAAAPKKMSWANVASQPAKPQVQATKTKKPGVLPPPAMIPSNKPSAAAVAAAVAAATASTIPEQPPAPPVAPAAPPQQVQPPMGLGAGSPPSGPPMTGSGPMHTHAPMPPQQQQQPPMQHHPVNNHMGGGGPLPPMNGPPPRAPGGMSNAPGAGGPMMQHSGPPPPRGNRNHANGDTRGPPPPHHMRESQGPPPPHFMRDEPPRGGERGGGMPPHPPSSGMGMGGGPPGAGMGSGGGSNKHHPVLETLRSHNEYNPKTFDFGSKSARYFVIKSFSEDDIHRSIKYEIWCSTEHGNKRLDAAFKERQDKGPIYLLFSVNGSGHFCGMAEMLSGVDYSNSGSVWVQDKFKGQFKVKWIYVKDVPNGQLRHIRLENNENKPVTNSRDTQEVPAEKGKLVLKIIHSYKHQTSIFDDFIHYEKRQEEEDSKKSQMGSGMNHHHHDDRRGGGGRGGHHGGDDRPRRDHRDHRDRDHRDHRDGGGHRDHRDHRDGGHRDGGHRDHRDRDGRDNRDRGDRGGDHHKRPQH